MTGTVWVGRDQDGKINVLGANCSPGYNDEQLPADHAEVTAFRSAAEEKLAAVLNPPLSVTPRQARLALHVFGLLEQVEAAVEAAGGTTKISWEFATEISRNDPLVASLSAALNIPSEQLDALFELAVTL